MKMIALMLCLATPLLAWAAEAQRTYENRLKPIADPKPLLADYPQWVEPVRETTRMLLPLLPWSRRSRRTPLQSWVE